MENETLITKKEYEKAQKIIRSYSEANNIISLYKNQKPLRELRRRNEGRPLVAKGDFIRITASRGCNADLTVGSVHLVQSMSPMGFHMPITKKAHIVTGAYDYEKVIH